MGGVLVTLRDVLFHNKWRRPTSGGTHRSRFTCKTQGYHFCEISGKLEISGNSAKVREFV